MMMMTTISHQELKVLLYIYIYIQCDMEEQGFDGIFFFFLGGGASSLVVFYFLSLNGLDWTGLSETDVMMMGGGN